MPAREVGAGVSPAVEHRRPDGSLLTYYLLSSLLLGPFFPIALIPYYFKYRSLHYEFDDEGITMRWGVLFRKEISLTYARIQDIHLISNVVERWLGLARIQIQTASGSSDAEMTIEGLQDYQKIRNELYSRMRGVAGTGRVRPPADHQPSIEDGGGLQGHEMVPSQVTLGELTTAIEETTAELRRLRESIARSRKLGSEGGTDAL